MSKSDSYFFEIYADFMFQINYFIEEYEYLGKRIGSGVLFILYIGSQVKCTMQELMYHFKLEKKPSTVTRKIDTLVNLSLVNRTDSSEDRRNKNLKLTRTGKNLYEKIVNEQMQRFLDMKRELGLSNEKYTDFFACITRLNEH
jgi:DNA-binding MarR family transcriptional regulator